MDDAIRKAGQEVAAEHRAGDDLFRGIYGFLYVHNMHHMIETLAAAAKEIADFRADKGRLDWLEHTRSPIQTWTNNDGEVVYEAGDGGDGDGWTGLTLREAIDTAMTFISSGEEGAGHDG